MTEFLLTPPPPEPLTGDEPLAGVNATVLDFWAFAMSNLTMNNVRGYLAEFLVARAVGARGPRVEWDAYDVLSPEGITIEVKSSAYVQAWEQRSVSRITFSGLSGRVWSSGDGLTAERTFNADVYVFAVETAQTHEEYDPLTVDQWQFHVVARSALEALGQQSLGLAALQRIAGPAITYDALADAIRSAGGREPLTPVA